MGPTFIETNVFVYAVGRPHPLRETAQTMLRERLGKQFLRLAQDLTMVWPIDGSDVLAARDPAVSEPALGARDLLHLAVCRRHGAVELLSFDRALAAAFAGS